jgi:hypothetical protein
VSAITVCDYCGEAIDPEWVVNVAAFGRTHDKLFDHRQYHGDQRPDGRSCYSVVADAILALED